MADVSFGLVADHCFLSSQEAVAISLKATQLPFE